MAFAHSAQTENEPAAAGRRAGLVGMGNDARIEQCRRFEGIFVQEIGADQPALQLGEIGCAASASSISSARASNFASRLRWRPWKFSRTSANWLAAVSASSASTAIDDMIGAGLVEWD